MRSPCMHGDLRKSPCTKCAVGKDELARLTCFIKYSFWKTDPLPVEVLISWLSITWGLRFFVEPGYKWFGAITQGAFRTTWGLFLIAVGLAHISCLLETNRVIKGIRWCGVVGLCLIWVFSAGMYIYEVHHPLSTPSVLALAALWVLVRHEVR